ncbi:MAG: hypothetical protein MZU95_07295 [Desulfomicrobium escambiense]|nr:hypothetical protein [Desulfomicrobium escambiense]
MGEVVRLRDPEGYPSRGGNGGPDGESSLDHVACGPGEGNGLDFPRRLFPGR